MANPNSRCCPKPAFLSPSVRFSARPCLLPEARATHLGVIPIPLFLELSSTLPQQSLSPLPSNSVSIQRSSPPPGWPLGPSPPPSWTPARGLPTYLLLPQAQPVPRRRASEEKQTSDSRAQGPQWRLHLSWKCRPLSPLISPSTCSSLTSSGPFPAATPASLLL